MTRLMCEVTGQALLEDFMLTTGLKVKERRGRRCLRSLGLFGRSCHLYRPCILCRICASRRYSLMDHRQEFVSGYGEKVIVAHPYDNYKKDVDFLMRVADFEGVRLSLYAGEKSKSWYNPGKTNVLMFTDGSKFNLTEGWQEWHNDPRSI